MMPKFRSSYWTPDLKLKNFLSEANSMQEHHRQLKEAIAKGEITDFKIMSWTYQVQSLKEA